MAKLSVFRTVGIGRVGSNKELRSKNVDIVPLEWLPMHDKEMASTPTPMTYKTKDADGVETQGAVVTDMVINAEWLPGTSNRLTAPDVRRGERVLIYQVGDADKFYWQPTGMDDNLRKLETIVFGISATTNEGDTVLSPTNMYWFEFSSHSKKLAFSSSKANGEPFVYEMYFDFDAGEFMLKDDIGNFINLISKLNLIHLQNAKGTFVKLDQKDIKAYAPQDILADAVRDVTVTAGKNMMLKAGVMATIDGGGSFMQLTAGNTILRTPQFIGRL